MSWDDLKPQAKVNLWGPRPSLRVALIKMRGSRARVSVLIRREIMSKLCQDKARRFKVSLGRGEHQHQLRLTRADDGNFETTEMGTARGGGTFRIMLPVVERLPDEVHKSQECTFALDEKAGVLMIDMPSWAWFKPK